MFTLQCSLRPISKGVHGNSVGLRYLSIGVESLDVLVERDNHPLIERAIMQLRLEGGEVLRLHDFRRVPFEPGRREYRDPPNTYISPESWSFKTKEVPYLTIDK